MNNVPEIRFKGFTNAWEQWKLGEVGDIVTGSTPPTSDLDNYSDDGIIWVTPTDIDMLTISTTAKHLSEKGQKIARAVPAYSILVTCIASIGKNTMVTLPASFNQQINAVVPNENNNPYFLLTQSEMWSKHMKNITASTTMQIVNKSEFSKIVMLFPCKREQTAIGNFFRTLDNIIAARKRKLDGLRELKSGYLQQMFPQDGERVPRVRFAGFNEEWVEHPIKDLVSPVIREVPKPEVTYTRLSVRSHAKGTFHQIVNEPSTVAMDKLYVVKTNDLIVNITFAWEHAIAIANIEDDGLLVSHRFPTFVIDKSDVNFIRYSVSLEGFRRKMDLISPGGAGRNRVLNKNDFLLLNLTVPRTREEQSQIGDFFYTIDAQIAFQSQKVETLKQLKAAYLQKMFA